MQTITRASPHHWVQLNFEVPIQEILEEYSTLETREHRPEDGHSGWYGVTVFGTEDTRSHWETGTGEWKDCPKTREFVESLPYSRIDQVRFLVLKPGGFIKEHVDVPDRFWLDPLHIALKYPEGCVFYQEGIVPFETGKSFVINIHYPHYVMNETEEDRVHLVVNGKKRADFYDYSVAQRLESEYSLTKSDTYIPVNLRRSKL